MALAASLGRDYVMPDDVKRVAPVVLEHRLLLTPDAELRGLTPADVLGDVLGSVAVPGPPA
jgi:MoxR-like ATPase